MKRREHCAGERGRDPVLVGAVVHRLARRARDPAGGRVTRRESTHMARERGLAEARVAGTR